MNGDENSSRDMGRFVDACHAISDAAAVHVLVVHHSGKDSTKGARGHSSLRAATDVELEVAPGVITVTKSRDYTTGTRFGFRLESVELGANRHGRTVTTAVAVDADPPTKATKAPALKGRQKSVMDALATALADHGQPSPSGSSASPNSNVVEFGTWENAAIRALPGENPDWRKRDRFKSAAKTLQLKGIVGQVDGWVWPV